MKNIFLIFPFLFLSCYGYRNLNPIQNNGVDQKSILSAKDIDKIENFIENNSYKLAESKINKALKEGVIHPKIFHYKALIIINKNNDELKECLPFLSKAIELSPSWVEPRIEMALVYMELSRPMAAKSVMTEIESLFPEHPYASFVKATIAYTTGKNKEAMEHLTKALKREERYPPALNLAWQISLDEGNEKKAKSFLYKYLAVKSNSITALNTLANLEEQSDNYMAAIKYYRISNEIKPSKELERKIKELIDLQR